MKRHLHEPILLVGSIPGETAGDVMRQWGEGLGARLAALPDGEVGDRRIWIIFLAHRVYNGHPALETVGRPRPYDPEDPADWRGPDGDWIPMGYEDQWLFKVKDGVSALHFDTLGYAAAAIDSYHVFERLRDEAVIAPEVRFQICLPLPESGTRMFLTEADDMDTLWDAYSDAMKRELATIFGAIPAGRVSVQWDVCVELLTYDPASRAMFPWEANGEPLERYRRALADLSPHVPGDALLGVHLCYGDLGHKHMVEPDDLRYCVDLANATIEGAGRSVDFVHMPVPRERDDDAYFKPLADLKLGDAKLYLGLVHTTGGMQGNQRRLATARRHAEHFGVATECGFGRRPLDQMPVLLEIHRALADAL
jgi:hypothetical protein